MMFLWPIFVIISFKFATAIFGDVLSETDISEAFDLNLNSIRGLEGAFHSVDNNEAEAMIDSDLSHRIQQSAIDNLYLLYTRKNVIIPQMLHYNNVTSIKISYFNPNIPLVVLSHGWTGNQNANLNPVLRDAFLRRGNYNVIVLDWSWLSYSNYITSTAGVPIIGQSLGMFLVFLKSTTGIPYDQMHLIGHSLGAHVMGNAGRQLEGQVARITALDPAGPLWNFNPNCVSKSDAVYVEVIHTNSGYTLPFLGIGRNVGHADFYPNGGSSQPGCGTNLCSHDKSWQIFAAAIVHQHLIGKECANQLQLTFNSCNGKSLIMGNIDLKSFGWGIYRFNTDMFYPYKMI